MEAVFYDDQIEKAYSEFSAMVKIIGFLSFLAISIASMGLLGMVVFTTETRLREISIRKVLGATEGHLIYMLSRGFLLLLAVSALIALPATYFLFDQVFLSDIVHRAPIGISELLLSIAVVMGVALLMIGSQTLRVARSNPAEVLKNE
jgi:ABC-type antimicrobial peptide transport system permease subunit